MIRLLTIPLLLCATLACGQQKTQALKKDWQRLDNPGFTIDYPSTWYLDQSQAIGTSFIIFARSAAEGVFRENVNLMIQDLTQYKLSLDQYVDISLQQVKDMLANSIVIESKRIKEDGGEYHQIIYAGDQGEFHLKWKQHYRIINDKAYVLTFTATQSTFEEFSHAADATLSSFLIKR